MAVRSRWLQATVSLGNAAVEAAYLPQSNCAAAHDMEVSGFAAVGGRSAPE